MSSTPDNDCVSPGAMKSQNAGECVIKMNENSKPVKWEIPFFSLFRYTSTRERCLYVSGFLVTFAATWAVPALNLIYGAFVNTLVHYEAAYSRATNGSAKVFSKGPDRRYLMDRFCDDRIIRSDYWSAKNYDTDFLLCQVHFLTGTLFLTALWYAFTVYLSLLCFEMAGFSQAQSLKQRFFRAILHQDIEWFDQQIDEDEETGKESTKKKKKKIKKDKEGAAKGDFKIKSLEFSTKMAVDLKQIENGMNENLCLLLYFSCSIFWSLSFSLYFGWKLAMAIFITTALIVNTSNAILTRIQSRYTQKEIQAYGIAGAVASEVFTALRTVFAFGGEGKAIEQYNAKLGPATRSGYFLAVFSSLGTAISWSGVYFGMAIGVWYGVQLIIENANDQFNVGTIILVFWCAAAVGWNAGFASPYYQAVTTACLCAKDVYAIIEAEPKIHQKEASSKQQTLPPLYQPSIDFRNVTFIYPSRKSASILSNFSLTINPGEVVAIVGPSGCGKSTLIQLIQRFYDPNSGGIFLDGANLCELDVGWLREQFGVVGQEPVLFDCTIEENIRLGAPDEAAEKVTMADIEAAAREANAHEFINKLPEAYGTMVGVRGAQLSGGQKQRIAIARALIKNPKILLLDEATSALDLKSESVVQAALDRASQGRTTIIIAHRLSTIQNADRIICLGSNGSIVEMGTHEALIELKGAYFELVNKQVVDVSTVDSFDTIDLGSKETCQHFSETESQASAEHPEVEGGGGEVRSRARSKTISLHKASEGQVDASVSSISKFSENYATFPVLWRILQMIFQSRVSTILGIICSCLFGLSVPIYSFIFGNFVGIFANETVTEVKNTSSEKPGFGLDEAYLQEQSIFYLLTFIGLSIFALISSFAQLYFFSVTSQKLTSRLRILAFSSMLAKPLPWHEKPENSSGNLCSTLANDPIDIQGSTGPRMAMFCQAVSSLLVSFIIGLLTCWNLSLVALIFVPIIIYSACARVNTFGDQHAKSKDSNVAAAKLGEEAIVNVRTIASLHKESFFEKKYQKLIEKGVVGIQRKFHLKSLQMACASGAPLVGYAATFLYGGHLVANHDLTTAKFLTVSEAIIFGAMVFGQACIFSSDFAKAKLSAINLFQMIDSVNSKEDEDEREPSVEANRFELKAARCTGEIEFRNVTFSYPSRPTVKVLNGISFKVAAGQKVALVGGSGCGKSTILQLLERFYESNSGEILLDQVSITKCPLPWLRYQMAFVSQEPMLFSTSIGENIAYGDNRQKVQLEEISQAARKAAIHADIQAMAKKYDTKVGFIGALLSGGQKQRIAIARACLRNAPILLLDEATSALDANSEQRIQETLDEAANNRTCLIIAHRLSTIRNVDKILYIDKGVVVEEGSHEQLLSQRGHYWTLFQQQTISTRSSRANLQAPVEIELELGAKDKLV